jgi:SAM-dependent methyltransferase
MDISAEYRASEQEKLREESLLGMVGEGDSILEIGPYDGYHTAIFAKRFRRVVALDLEKPNIPGVENVKGDARDLQFPDRSFDVVVAAEVLEHVPGVEKAASEIARVARQRVVIGVPYRQDIRVARVTCRQCGHISPPWGHINSFDEHRLKNLFAGLDLLDTHFIGETNLRTTAFAAWLMDKAGNPWGAYDPKSSHCYKCGAPHARQSNRTPLQKALASTAWKMNEVQMKLNKPHANWIHVLFARRNPASS